VIKSKILVLPAEDAARVTEPVLLRKALPAVLADKLLAVVSTLTPEAPMSPEVEARVTVEAVSVPAPPNIDPEPLAVRLMVEIVPVPAATFPFTAMEPLLAAAVRRSKVLPLPADEAFRLTDAAESLRKTLPEVLAERLALLVIIRVAVELPILPEVEAKLTVVPVRVPLDSEITPEPLAVRLIVEIVPVPATTFPFTAIEPLLAAAVIKSNVLVLPADDAVRVTEPVLLRKALPAVLAERLLAVVKTRAPDAPISAVPVPVLPSLRLTVVATS